MPNQETIDQAIVTSQEEASTSTSNEPLDPRLEEVARENDPYYGLPEKFRGKTPQEIAKSYMELEKQYGKIGSEKSHIEKEREEAKARAEQAERERQHLYQQLQNTVPRTPVQEVDPLVAYEEEVAKDPIEAIRSLGKKVIADTQKTRAQILAEVQAQQAANFYQRQRAENPDFAANEKDMQRLAQQYMGFLRPEVANTPETIALLYKLARAENMERYVDEAVKKRQSASESVKQEKRAAFSESSNSQGESKVAFDDLSLEEQERILGRAR